MKEESEQTLAALGSGARATLVLHGKEWTAVADYGGQKPLLYLIRTEGKEMVKIDYADLTPEEKAFFDQANYRARVEKGRKWVQDQKRFKAKEERESIRVEEGAVSIRGYVWDVEPDCISRFGEVYFEAKLTAASQRIRLKFCELSNDEIAQVMQAKERQIKYEGVGGALRRFGRKLGF